MVSFFDTQAQCIMTPFSDVHSSSDGTLTSVWDGLFFEVERASTEASLTLVVSSPNYFLAFLRVETFSAINKRPAVLLTRDSSTFCNLGLSSQCSGFSLQACQNLLQNWSSSF